MWIKICGLTRVADVLAVIQAGADAIGFNFFSGSKRCLSTAAARALAEAAQNPGTDHPRVDLVGVFVNATPGEIQAIVKSVGLDAIQLHGDESPAEVANVHEHCPTTPIIRAFRVDPKNHGRTLESIDQLTALVPVSAILLDAFVAGEFGGTGTVIDLTILPEYFAQPRPPLILAGGLTPGNVASIAAKNGLWGIDTASGVESSPGFKDAPMINAFVAQARACHSAVTSTDQCVRIQN